MKRRFRLGRHELDLAVEETSDPQAAHVEEPAPNGKLVFSRTWEFGEMPAEQDRPADERRRPESELETPVEAVSEQPFRLRNLLLVPSAMLIVVGAIGRYDSGWFLLLLALGVGGIGAWEVLRRRRRDKGSGN
jgi:hypothetical protein